jgi:hypothetical protein
MVRNLVLDEDFLAKANGMNEIARCTTERRIARYAPRSELRGHDGAMRSRQSERVDVERRFFFERMVEVESWRVDLR